MRFNQPQKVETHFPSFSLSLISNTTMCTRLKMFPLTSLRLHWQAVGETLIHTMKHMKEKKVWNINTCVILDGFKKILLRQRKTWTIRRHTWCITCLSFTEFFLSSLQECILSRVAFYEYNKIKHYKRFRYLKFTAHVRDRNQITVASLMTSITSITSISTKVGCNQDLIKCNCSIPLNSD